MSVNVAVGTFTPPRTVQLAIQPSVLPTTHTNIQLQIATNSGFTQNLTSKTLSKSAQVRTETLAGPLGVTYYFRARATGGSGGNQAWGPTVLRAIPNVPTAPGQPTMLYIPPNMSVAWAAPSSNGGASITQYQVMFSPSSSFGTPQIIIYTTPTVRSAVANLTPGSTWYVRVRALNSQGYGPWSAVRSMLVVNGPRVRHAGTWKPTVAYVRQGGVWKFAVPYVRVAGTWKIGAG